MASNNYIELGDISDTHIKSFPPEILQQYVDKTNDWYEDLAKSKGVRIEEIAYPTPQLIKDMLISKLQMDFCANRFGGSSSSGPKTDDKYVLLYGVNKETYTDLIVRITPELIEGDITRYSSTTIMGRKRGAYGRDPYEIEPDDFCGRR